MTRREPIQLHDLPTSDRARLNRIRSHLEAGLTVFVFERDFGWSALPIEPKNHKRIHNIERRTNDSGDTRQVGYYSVSADYDADMLIDTIIDDLDFSGLLIPKLSYEIRQRKLK